MRKGGGGGGALVIGNYCGRGRGLSMKKDDATMLSGACQQEKGDGSRCVL